MPKGERAMSEQSKPYGVIVVALDNPARTALALNRARELARAFGSTLVLIRSARDVTPDPDPTVTAGGVTVADRANDAALRGMSAVPQPSVNAGTLHPAAPIDAGSVAGEVPHHIRNAEDTAATGELNILSNQLRDEGFLVEVADTADDLADSVVAEARVRGASLIVLATRRSGGLERLFGGDVADKILRDAACPVLVVPEAR